MGKSHFRTNEIRLLGYYHLKENPIVYQESLKTTIIDFVIEFRYRTVAFKCLLRTYFSFSVRSLEEALPCAIPTRKISTRAINVMDEPVYRAFGLSGPPFLPRFLSFSLPAPSPSRPQTDKWSAVFHPEEETGGRCTWRSPVDRGGSRYPLEMARTFNGGDS